MSSTDLREYELVYILQPDVDEGAMNDLSNRLAQAIGSQQGKIVATEIWGRRNLAYPIKKYGVGHYVLQRFEMNPQGTTELDRLLRFNENVMRYLLTRTDE
jgi:small subunit ribosomal protein S6